MIDTVSGGILVQGAYNLGVSMFRTRNTVVECRQGRHHVMEQ
jgi:hypothetical protein